MSRHGRVADEARFDARREELGAHFMVAVVRRQDECGVGVIELARNGEHFGVVERVCVEVIDERRGRHNLLLVHTQLVDDNLTDPLVNACQDLNPLLRSGPAGRAYGP